MKALTISQPYASLIADGEKWVENRQWLVTYRGPLVIHAGKGTQYLTPRQLEKYRTGAALAVARAAGCFALGEIKRQAQVNPTALAPGTSRTWSELAVHPHAEGKYCLVLEELRRLEPPIPMGGCLGVFNPPTAVLAELQSRGIKW